jgi:hypothetical protein
MDTEGFVPMDEDSGEDSPSKGRGQPANCLDALLAKAAPLFGPADAVIVAATVLDLLALVLPIFCGSNQCWAATSYLDSPELHVIGYLFCVPLVCFMLHATGPAAAVLLARARKQPPPVPQLPGALRRGLAVALPAVSLLSTLGVLGLLLSMRDMIFGGPNQLGGTVRPGRAGPAYCRPAPGLAA